MRGTAGRGRSTRPGGVPEVPRRAQKLAFFGVFACLRGKRSGSDVRAELFEKLPQVASLLREGMAEFELKEEDLESVILSRAQPAQATYRDLFAMQFHRPTPVLRASRRDIQETLINFNNVL